MVACTVTFSEALESGGDGIAVVVQTVGPGVVGSSGGELGFGGLAGSLAVEFELSSTRGQGSAIPTPIT